MKSFIAFFLARPVLCLMLVMSGCFLGIIALAHLPIGLMPNLASPGITIVTRYPGVSAEKIHQMITIPIERQVSDLGNIEEILSVSSEGESKVNLLFSNDADIKIKMVEASERIDLVSSRFPRDVNSPYIVQYDPSDRPVFVVSFSSTRMDLRSLREHVDRRIKLLFERVDGVSEVFVGGGLEREIEVAVDPGKLVTSGTAVSTVQSAIADSNTFAPGGRVARPREMSLYTDARVKSIDQLARLPIPSEKGTLILSNVARVSDAFREPDSISRTNGEERVTIYVQKSGKANTLSLTTACEQIVAGLREHDVTASIIHNQGEHIRKAVRRVAFECMFGGLIALAVLQLFLQKRSISLLIGGAIPACILSTFFLMFLLGIDLNAMTLSGLALGAGMLVDNSVVVCESIQRHAEGGETARNAVLKGTAVVFPEIVSSTLCTIVVFLPLLFTEPDTRRLYSGLALTVSMSLLLSLAFAVTVLPGFMLAMAQAWHRPDLPAKQVTLAARIGRRGVQLHRQMMTLVFRDYRVSLGIPALLLIAAPVLFRLSRKEFVDPVDAGQIEATADLKSGTHLDRTVEIIRDAEATIRKSPLVAEVSTKIEKSHATFHIRLRDPGSKTSEQIIEQLRKLTDHNEEAFIYYNASSENESAQDLSLDFLGDDPAVLKTAAKEAAGLIQGRIDGVSQVVLRFREPRTDLLIYPDRTKTASTGGSIARIGSTLRTLLSGSIATKFYDGEREVDVRVRGIAGTIGTTDDVEQLLLTGASGATPLLSLAQIRSGEGETHIYRKNKRTTATITIRALGRSLDAVAADVEQTLSHMNLPPNTVYAFGKEYKRRIENQNQMLIAVGVSILAVYLLLGALFESFLRPFLILLTVPLSIACVLVVFTVMRTPLSMSVYIGMIMLSGIVVSNSILVVSTIHRAVGAATRVGGPMLRPILRAAQERLRPVMITTGASVTGMLPMALDSSPGAMIWRPLALTVASGLAFSVTISLLIVPFACWLYYRRNSEVAST